jgi:tetratricopeptide (TPR) repeat protein
MKISKNGVIIAATFVIIGFFIGFSYTNARNRDYLKQKTEEARREAFANAKNVSDASGGGAVDKSENPHGKGDGTDNIPVDDVLKMARETRDNVEQQLLAARYLASKNRLPEAQECIEAALKKDPKNFEANAVMGNFHFDQEKYDEAAKWYEKALENGDPKIELEKRVSVTTDLGLTYYYRKPQQLPKAIEYYRKAMSLDPKHAPTLINLTVAYTDAKNFDQAREIVAALDKAYPGNPDGAKLRQRIDDASKGASKAEPIPTH